MKSAPSVYDRARAQGLVFQVPGPGKLPSEDRDGVGLDGIVLVIEKFFRGSRARGIPPPRVPAAAKPALRPLPGPTGCCRRATGSRTESTTEMC